MTTNPNGRCSCLKSSAFKLLDRVQVVYMTRSWSDYIQVGDTGTVLQIYSDLIVIRKDDTDYHYSVRPQHIKHIPNDY